MLAHGIGCAGHRPVFLHLGELLYNPHTQLACLQPLGSGE